MKDTSCKAYIHTYKCNETNCEGCQYRNQLNVSNIDIAIHCLKSESERHSEVCEECPVYGQTGCDHCYDDSADTAISALETVKAYKELEEKYGVSIEQIVNEFVKNKIG